MFKITNKLIFFLIFFTFIFNSWLKAEIINRIEIPEDIKTGIITLDPYVSIENAPHIFPRLDKVCIASDKPKLDVLKEWCAEYNLELSEVAYIGDDLPDIPVLENVGFSGCPSDAVNEVKKVCDYVCTKSGGNGAVREFVDLILNLINCVLDKN